MDNEVQKKRKGIPVYLGIASVWFGAHCGPGVASGKQTAVFFSVFKKWGFVSPILAMGLMGLCIFYAVEFTRMSGVKNFKEMTDKLFYPYEKIFSTFFELTFVATVLMVVGGCIATGAAVLNQYIGLPIIVGTLILAGVTIILSIYGDSIVRASSTIMTIFIILCLISMFIMGINSPKSQFTSQWNSVKFSDTSPIQAFMMAIVYTGFQAAGNIGNAVSVAQGIETRKDSIKAAVTGIILNVLLINSIAMLLFAFPEALVETLPNFFIVSEVGAPILMFAYVAMVILAVLSTNVSFSFAVVARYAQYLPMEKGKKRDFIVTLALVVVCVIVSAIGLDAIVSKGYKYLGYSSIFVVIIPILIAGFKKTRQLEKEIEIDTPKKVFH